MVKQRKIIGILVCLSFLLSDMVLYADFSGIFIAETAAVSSESEREEELPVTYSYMDIDNTEYTEEEAAARIQPYAGYWDLEAFKNIYAPSIANMTNEPQYSMMDGFSEYISTYTGEMSLKFTDATFKGKNGLDLNLTRLYQTNQALWGERRVELSTSNNLYDTVVNSNYIQNRYALGAGWSFGFPSIEVWGDEDFEPELYYHTGEGNVYHVNFGSRNLSNLDGYSTEDIKFCEDKKGLYQNGDGTKSRYYVKHISGTRQYFGKDGRLLGIVDRFGNKIDFKHKEAMVSNMVPGGTFGDEDGTPVLWEMGNGMTNNGEIISFNSGTARDSYLNSKYIEVEPNTKYKFSRIFYMGDGGEHSKFTASDVQLDICEYSTSRVLRRATPALSRSYFTANGEWNATESEFITSPNTYYIKVKLTLAGAKGTMLIDDFIIDKSRPLISEITDTIGRKFKFDYGDSLYATKRSAGRDTKTDLNITVTMPNDDGRERVFTYKRIVQSVVNQFTTETAHANEMRKFWILDAFSENGQNMQAYHYRSPDTSTTGKQYFDSFSFFKQYNAADANSHAGMNVRPLIQSMDINNTRISYVYEMTPKWLGEEGYYKTRRVISRSESYKKPGTNAYTTANVTSYNYGSGYMSNETGYPSYTQDYMQLEDTVVTVTAPNQLKTRYTYTGSTLKAIKTSMNPSLTTGEYVQYEFSYDGKFYDRVYEVKTTYQDKNNSKKESYSQTKYTEWGSVESQTSAMTKAERDSNTLKEKLTVTYQYYSTIEGSTGDIIRMFAIPEKKTWYQNWDKPPLSEEIMFDSRSRVSRVVNAKGEAVDFEYDDELYYWQPVKMKVSDHNNTYTLYPGDYIIEYNWDKGYGLHPYKVIQHDMGVKYEETYVYDFLYDRLKTYTDSGGMETNYQYDGLGRIKNITYPAILGENGNIIVTENFEYDFGKVLPSISRTLNYAYVSKSANGKVFAQNEIYFDDFGRNYQASAYDYEKGQWISETIAYNNLGLVEKETDVKGDALTYSYDNLNQPVEIKDKLGNVTGFEYLINSTEMYFKPYNSSAKENHLLREFDIRGNITAQYAYPKGRTNTASVERYAYDVAGNVLTYTDANNKQTRYEYNELNLLVKTVLPDAAAGQYLTQSYSKTGAPTFSKEYALDAVRTSVTMYNGLNLPALVEEAGKNGAGFEYHTYNQAKLMATYTDKAQKIHLFEYDDMGNLTEDSVSDDSISVRYNEYGSPTKISQTDGFTLIYSYDKMGRVSNRRIDGFNTAFSYDIKGKLTSVTDNFGLKTEYTPDTMDRLGTVKVDNQTYTYAYYEDGMLKSVTYPNGAITSYTYDNANRVEMVETKKGAAVISSYAYTYYANGNINTVKDKDNQTTTYTYDGQNRLTRVVYPSNTVSYTYDGFGNRETETTNGVKKTYVYDGYNRLIKVEGQSGEYKYDKMGSTQTTPDGGAFVYDDRDRVAEYRKDGLEVIYEYDPTGIRIGKTVNGSTTKYQLDTGGNVIAETDGSGTVTAQIVHGHKPLGRKVNGQWYYYIYNVHGDVVQVTDINGNIVNMYEYDVWGNILSANETVPNPIRYAGEYYDSESGLIYLRARYYSPKLGRFTQADPAKKDRNWYAYCSNNPVMLVDPSGMYDVGLLTELLNYQINYVRSPSNMHVGANKIRDSLKNNRYYVENFDPELNALLEQIIAGANSGYGSSPELTRQAIAATNAYWKNSDFEYARDDVIFTAGLTVAGAILIKGGISIVGSSGGGSVTLNFSKTAAQHMTEAARFVPIQILQEAIKSGTAAADPQGTNMVMYYIEMFRNGNAYTLEVLYDAAANTIKHFKYY